ncbi:MAG: cytochrome c oxidase subunit II [Rhodospirillaceae bacterium]|nr:cytochrome c oxidase subunit II [Rhodospirillaceae bacterium]
MKLLTAILTMAATTLLASQALAEDTLANPPASWDHLWNEVMIDLYIIGGIFSTAAIYMLIKFRAKSPDQVGTAKTLSPVQSIGWVLIPAAIFMADDFFLAANGWTVWNEYRRVPEDAMEIKATGYQWYWEFEYEDGTVTEELVMPVGQPVVLRMTSSDVIHSFGVPHYRVKEDVMPGRITYIWLNPVEENETVVQCAEFCGNDHANMWTAVRAVPQEEFDAWLSASADEPTFDIDEWKDAWSESQRSAAR